MSDVEALMWNLEKDPHLSATFANVTLFDRPLDLDRLRRRMERAALLVPRLRQRVVPAFGRLAPPLWADDPDFDIDFHVRRVALPAPGSLRQLLDLATVVANDGFDRTRPLWSFVVFDGLAGGRSAMLQKMHHTITDGEGGVRMSEQFIDLAADDPEPPMPDGLPIGRGVGDRAGLVANATDALAHGLRRQVGVTRRAVGELGRLARQPERAMALGAEAARTVPSVLRQLVVADRARSPLWTERSLRRHFSILSVGFDEAKRASKALGGSINDIFVTGVAGGAGAYHRSLGTPVDELRISMPVSTRTDRSAGGNAFAPARVLVPTGADPVARFAETRSRLDRVKREPALSMAGALACAANLLPTSALVRMTRRQVETVDFAASNVRGAPFALYIAGARMEANHPMGPLGGTAFNLTTMSYDGRLDMGLNTDTGAVTEPDLLHRCIEEAFAELLAAAEG
ncbi:wax ester/triacylglycerol synthase family O-acyltransferase [soil metagenome]